MRAAGRGFTVYDARKKGSDVSDAKMLLMLLDPEIQKAGVKIFLVTAGVHGGHDAENAE